MQVRRRVFNAVQPEGHGWPSTDALRPLIATSLKDRSAFRLCMRKHDIDPFYFADHAYNRARTHCAGAAVMQMTEMLFFDLVANDAANRRATYRAGGAAAGQDRAAYSADSGADRGIPILRRHSGAPCQTEQHG